MKYKATRFAPLTTRVCMTVAVAVAFTFGPSAQAALYWDGNDIATGAGNTTVLLNKVWGTNTVWNSDPAGVTNTFTAVTGAGDDLFFVAGPSASSGNTAFNPTVTGTQSANSITFQSSGAQTLSGGTAINLGAGGLAGPQLAYAAISRGAVTISTPLSLTASQSWVNNATTAMTVSGAISGTGDLAIQNNAAGTTGTFTLSTGGINQTGSITNSGAGGGTTTISGVVGAAVTGITQNSATSTLALSGANAAYAGTTTLTAGILKGTNTATTDVLTAFGTGAIILNGGTLQLRANSSTGSRTFAVGNNVTTGSSGVTIDVNNNGSNVNNTFNMGNLSLAAGQFNVTGGNSYLLRFAGTTTLAGDTTFNPTTANLTLIGAIGDGGGNFGITKTGAATLIVAGTSTYTGTTSIQAGPLQATITGALPGFATPGRVAVADGATLTVNAGTTGSLFTSANLDSLRSTATFGANSKLGIDTSSAGFIYGSTITDTAGGALGLLKQGGNTLTLSATTNTYSGGTFINGGTLSFAALNTLGTGGITFNSGTLQYATGNTADISTRTVTLTGSGAINTNGNNVTFANSVGNSGTGGFTKTGLGTLTLSAANLYTGVTTVSGGILSVSDNNQLGSGTAGIVFAGGSVSTNGGVLRITGSGFSTSRTISNSAQFGFGIDVAAGATGAFTNTAGNSGGGYATGVVFGAISTTANSPGGTLNFAGGFSTNNNNNGASSGGPSVGVRFRNITANVTGLFNVGIGTANTNAGNITVGPGAGETTVVNLNGTGQFVAGAITNNATNNISVGGTPAGLSDVTNTGGTALLPSAATLNINSSNANAIQGPNLYVAYSGTTTAIVNQNAGGVVLSNTLTLGNLGTAANGTYHLGNGAATAASLTTPTIVKGAGAGTFNFNGGALNPTATSSATAFLGTGSTAVNATVDAGGAKINTGAFNVGVEQGLFHNVALGATDDGGLMKTGSGTLTLNGASTYTGATAINEGTLVVNGSLGASAVAVNSTGTLTGSGSFGGSVTVASGGHLALGVAATAALQVPLQIAGALTLQDGNILYLTATPTPANGVYTLSTAAGGVTYTAGTVNFSGGTGVVSANGNNLILTIGAGVSNFASWAITNGVSGEPASGDFYNDGLSNLVEYALGKNPTVPSQPPGSLTGGVLSFTKGSEAIANGDVNYVIEESINLVAWSPVVTQNAPNASTTISYTLPTGQPKEFARLKVIQVP